MSTAHSTVDAGVCGYVTEIDATADDEMRVRFKVESPCQNIRGLAGKLPVVDAYAEIGAGFDGEVHRAVRASLKGCCSGCVVPAGIFKAMQVAAGLALPMEVTLSVTKDEPLR